MHLHYPMDVASENVVLGVINGTMFGNARLVPGVLGNALYIDGQQGSRVEFGVHTQGCFFDPNQCTNGITISLWLKIHELATGFLGVIDSGGCSRTSYGICFNFQANGKIRFELLNQVGYNMSAFPAPSPLEWHFIVLIHLNGNIMVYIDGAKSALKTWAPVRQTAYSRSSRFFIGAWSSGGYGGHATVDELSVWYKALEPTDLLLVHMHEIWSGWSRGHMYEAWYMVMGVTLPCLGSIKYDHGCDINMSGKYELWL